MKPDSKKLIALAIGSVLSTGAHAASLQDALMNGKVSGGVSVRYITSSEVSPGVAQADADINHNKNSASAALSLNYLSGDFNGFKLGVGFQHGVDFEIHDTEGGPPWASEDDSRNSVDATNLHELYLDYSSDNSQLRLGRQEILFTPLLMNSGMFPMKDSFDAVVFTNKDIEKTTVKLFGVKRWVKRYGSDSNGGVVQEDYTFDSGLWSVWAKSNLIDKVTLTAQYLTFAADDTDNIGDPPVNTPAPPAITGGRSQWFLSAGTQLPLSHPVNIEAKYLGIDYDPASEPSSYMWGVKATTKINGFGLKLAYEAVGDDNMYAGTVGHVPMFGSYAGAPFTLTDPLFAGMSSISAAVSHNLGINGLKATLNVAHFSQTDEGVANSTGGNYDGASEIFLDLNYKVPSVKGLSTRAMLAYLDYDVESAADDDMTYARLFLDYKF